jgi:peptide/nickel transport system permease protein
VGACVLVLVLLACFAGEPLAERILHRGPDDIYPMAVDVDSGMIPAGPWTRVPNTHGVMIVKPDTPRTLFVLGADGILGRDLFIRVLDGGRTSLELAFGASLLAILLGTLLGTIGGYFGGWPDAVVSRFTEFIMGFPILLFLIAIGWTIGEQLNDLTLHGYLAKGVISLILVVGLFYSFYPARLVRAQVLQLKNQEFVEAAQMVGAGPFRIIFRHLFPHLVGSLAVYGAQLMTVTIFLEAALSILGIGIQLPDASWGNIIATNYGNLLVPPQTSGLDSAHIHSSYWIVLWPSVLLFITVVSFNLFGEGLRNALDPRSKN